MLAEVIQQRIEMAEASAEALPTLGALEEQHSGEGAVDLQSSGGNSVDVLSWKPRDKVFQEGGGGPLHRLSLGCWVGGSLRTDCCPFAQLE